VPASHFAAASTRIAINIAKLPGLVKRPQY
jgi:hypothetical protein